MTRKYSIGLALTLVLGLTLGAVAANGGGDTEQAEPQAPAAGPGDVQATTPPAPTPTPEEAIQQLEGERREPPAIDPQRREAAEAVPGARVPVDPNVVGLLADEDPPPLRREGEFVLNRRGRMVRSADGQHAIFVFDSNSENAVEPPMILMPCQLLENMEDLVRDRGDDMTFEVSGQVFVYRGANYLLPTMMRHRPNLDRPER